MRKISAFFKPNELELAQRYCSELLTEVGDGATTFPYYGPPEDGSPLIRIERFVEQFEQVTCIPLLARASEVAKEMLGARVCLFKDKINFRHPGSDGFGPHQDAAAGWGKYSPYFISVAVFIRDSKPESGGFEFALDAQPNTFYQSVNGKLDQAQFDAFTRNSLICPAGDAIAFDSYAPHQSHGNLTTAVIPHIILTFNDAQYGSHRDDYYADKRKSMGTDNGRVRFRVFEFGAEYAK